MAVTAIDVVRKFAPKAHPNYVAAFEDPAKLLKASGIVRPRRLAHFMAQCFHETGALTILVESGSYSEKGLGKMWDSGNWHRYFASREECVAMAAQCAIDHGEALFNTVYGGRMGNGPKESGDGWRYRGRGLLQTTGRESYEKFGRRCSVDFAGDPDLVFSAEHALKPALAEWDDKHLGVAADRNDIEVVTKGINGGIIGLDERKAWYAKILPFVTAATPVEESVEWQVQEKLNAAGFDCGEPDGVVGKNTRSAILAYRAAHDLKLRTDITPELLASLGIP